jgi:hypothetical protein
MPTGKRKRGTGEESEKKKSSGKNERENGMGENGREGADEIVAITLEEAILAILTHRDANRKYRESLKFRL